MLMCKKKKKAYRNFFSLILIFAEYELSVEIIIIRYIVLNLEDVREINTLESFLE